ncbi:ATP-dependent DNA ligase [Nocardioides pocheonensis]|uniref:DNA ligase n=1 Tax=Nocardioides pocheonensis TaxID=661485 RepID=A0A3N0GVA3_9ACTN|nr:ATP-dependent DNA ligase [Nocardioides pocheonensis]RNM16106.1 ATP-dependent DNA ligase [Nocardioides pocheonensis]
MELARLVSVSQEVAATRARTTKRALIAGLLAQAPPGEVEIVTAYLSGTLRQRRTGLGWRGLADLPEPAPEASVSVGEVDSALEQISAVSGEGSGTARRAAVADLFGRLTADEQRYLRGLVTGEVRQGALDSVVLDAIAEAAGVPVASVRRAAMFSALTGPVAVAALTGGEEALAAFDLEVGRPVRPMLASSAPDVPAGVAKIGSDGPLVVDTKLDGIRIQVHRRGREVLVFTRSLEEIGPRLPDVVEATLALPGGDLVLDGEAITLADDGTPRPFQETASRTSASGRDDRVHPFFFDLLAHEGASLVHEPARVRLERLDAVVPADLRTARLETDDPDVVADFFSDAVAGGQEGVILKRLDAPYDAGRRGSAWVKVKPRHTLDLVVLAVEWGSGRRRGWLSNIWLGARDASGDGFVMLGKTFKGMTDEMLAWQTERFLSLETRRDGHVVHLRPEQVVEIAFDGLQRSTRYPGGLALRFARVLRYRDDKTAEEADTIDTVRALAGTRV